MRTKEVDLVEMKKREGEERMRWVLYAVVGRKGQAQRQASGGAWCAWERSVARAAASEEGTLHSALMLSGALGLGRPGQVSERAQDG